MNLTFLFSYKCNKNCFYCDIPRLYKKDTLSLNSIKLYLNYVKQFENNIDLIELTGGEPGLLSKDFLKYFINFFNKQYIIYTNGKFLQYFNLFKNKIHKIYYHIIDINNIQYLQNNKITYVIIVYDNNIDTVINYVKNNPNNKYYLSLYMNRNNLNIKLTEYTVKKILQECKNYNIENYKNLQKYYNNIKICNKKIKPTLDFVYNKIYLCSKAESYGNVIDLNFKNIKKLLTNQIQFKYSNFCKKCIKYGNIYN